MLQNDQPRRALPARWLDGSVPLAIGLGAAASTCAVALATHRHGAPEWLGTLGLISLLANLIAADNARDGDAARGKRVIAAAAAAAAATLVAVFLS